MKLLIGCTFPVPSHLFHHRFCLSLFGTTTLFKSILSHSNLPCLVFLVIFFVKDLFDENGNFTCWDILALILTSIIIDFFNGSS